MRRRFTLIPIIALAAFVILAACNLPPGTPRPADIQATSVALTLSALGTQAVAPPAPLGTPTQAFAPSETSSPIPLGTPQNPLVVQDVLCWEGPGPVYEVVSAVKKGERVTLLGRGSTGAWWVIDNPIYHDPCWVVADALQFDTGFNLSGLKAFNPPPTPTPTATNTALPTATATRQE